MKVLIVDDSEVARFTTNEICKQRGHETFQAENGIEALEVLEQNSVDLVFTDLNMPQMDGIQLLKNMKNKGLSPIVIVVTTEVSKDIVQSAKSYGATGWITKPVVEDKFISILEAMEQKIQG